MKVSVIVPVYNVEEYIGRCLDSLVNQTLKDIEIIVVNDGSPDNSLEIIKKYMKKHKNIILIDDTNHGLSHARNIALAKATGEYIMYVDSDDYVDETIVEELVNNISDSDVCVCDIYKVINGENIYYKNHYEYGNENINLMLSHPGVNAKLYKKDLILSIPFLEGVYYEDLTFTPLVASKIKKVSYVKKPLYYYLIRDDSIMRKKKFSPKLDDIFIVLDYVKSKLNGYDEEIEYLYIEHLLYSATMRFLDYDEGRERLIRIQSIMRNYPNYRENKYYKKKSSKFKLVCFLSYHKMYKLLRILVNLKGKK